MNSDDNVRTGVVVNANDRGFQLQGMETWLNWSKFAPEPRTFPAPGHSITASLDKAGFVRKVVIGDGAMANEAVRKTDAYSMGEAKREAEATDTAKNGRNAVVAARNPQLDREFRLLCFTESRLFLNIAYDESTALQEVFSIAENIASWAEGRNE